MVTAVVFCGQLKVASGHSSFDPCSKVLDGFAGGLAESNTLIKAADCFDVWPPEVWIYAGSGASASSLADMMLSEAQSILGINGEVA